MSKLYRNELERETLYSLLKHPQVYIENQSWINRESFHHPTHKQIFDVFRLQVLHGGSTDPVVIGEKCIEAGAFDKDGVDIKDYINNIDLFKISADGAKELVRDLSFNHVLRKAESKIDRLKTKIYSSSSNDDKTQTIQELQQISNEIILPSDEETQPKKIFSGYKQVLIDRRDNPIDMMGYSSPFPTFNSTYGGFEPKMTYVFVGRGGIGKSTILHYFSNHLCKDHNLPTLILDTEMPEDFVRDRFFAMRTKIPNYAIRTGKVKFNPELAVKFEEEVEKLDEDMPLYIKHIPEEGIEEMRQIIFEWYYNEVGEGNPCVLVFDYLKCNSKMLKNNWSEHQALGELIDNLHKISGKINAILLTAVQANRKGDSFNRSADGVTDDSTIIADSDRIQRYAEFVAEIRLKTPDEIVLDEGITNEEAEEVFQNINRMGFNDLRFGTHKMIVFKGRSQGENAPGGLDLVSRLMPNGTYRLDRNFFNLHFNNFEIREKGTLRDITAHAENGLMLDDMHPNDNNNELL
jgi:replicative DNA helicase|tara:strand:+ start:31360 stop:32919 length:1560 start_codon:yes stop_codon:yes gene_type:complete